MNRPFAWVRFRWWSRLVRLRQRKLARAEARQRHWWQVATGKTWGSRP